MNSKKTTRELEINNHPVFQKAEQLSREADILNAIDDALNNAAQRNAAMKGPHEFLGKYGIELSEDLKVIFTLDPSQFRPIPQGSFEIILSKCKTYWKRDEKDGQIKQQTICFGIKIVPVKVLPFG